MPTDLFDNFLQICPKPAKPLGPSVFPLDHLITPTLKAAGSSPVGRTKKERHLLKADVFLFWVLPPKGRLHSPVSGVLGEMNYSVRLQFEEEIKKDIC